jgi:hypothetical protein
VVPRVPVKVLLDCQLDGVLFEVFLPYCSVPPLPLEDKLTVVVTLGDLKLAVLLALA